VTEGYKLEKFENKVLCTTFGRISDIIRQIFCVLYTSYTVKTVNFRGYDGLGILFGQTMKNTEFCVGKRLKRLSP
jgi:hypothetical protein